MLAAIASQRVRGRFGAAGMTAAPVLRNAPHIDRERAANQRIHCAQFVLVACAGGALAAMRIDRISGGGGLGADAAAEFQAVHHGNGSAATPSSWRRRRAGTEQPGQHGTLLQAHLVGNFLRRIAHHHLQHQRFPVFVIEPEQGLAHLRERGILVGREHVRFRRHQGVEVVTSRRLRSNERANSRRTIVSSQDFALLSSASPSNDFHARNSASCTTSSASCRSRPSQNAKRSRSGRKFLAIVSKRRRLSVPWSSRFMYKDRP